MALIKCPECGKEVSDKAPFCIHCGFPLKDNLSQEEVKDLLEKKGLKPDVENNVAKGPDIDEPLGNTDPNETHEHHEPTLNFLTQTAPTPKKRKKWPGLLIVFAAAVVVVVVVIANTGTKAQNVFSQYTDLIGKSYREIPGEYEVTHLTDDIAIAHVSPVVIWEISGEIEYYVFYDEDKQDYGDVSIVGWVSTENNDLTKEETEIFVNNMIDVYGQYDSKKYEEAEYSFSSDDTMYWWESQDRYNIKLMVYEDTNKISIAFQKK